MAEEGKPKRTVNFKAFAVLAGLLLVAAVVVWNMYADVSQSRVDNALASTENGSQEASTTPPPPAPSPPPQEPEGCWGTPVPQSYNNDADTRDRYAKQSDYNLTAAYGPYVMHSIVAGEDNKYLIFWTDFENADDVRKLALRAMTNLSFRANVCEQGFADVVFTIHYSPNDTRTFARFNPNVSDVAKYERTVAVERLPKNESQAEPPSQSRSLAPTVPPVKTGSLSETDDLGVKTKRIEVVGQVFGIHTPDFKPCVPGRECWWEVTVEGGGTLEWDLLTVEKPRLQEGQFIRAQADVSARVEKFMTKAEIEAHLPRLVSYTVVQPGTDVEASRVVARMRADAEALPTMHRQK